MKHLNYFKQYEKYFKQLHKAIYNISRGYKLKNKLATVMDIILFVHNEFSLGG